MVQKICPICDQVMKHPHFCRNCKQWIRHPYERESTCYLNEGHPEKEIACSYHGRTGEDTAGWVQQRTSGDIQSGYAGNSGESRRTYPVGVRPESSGGSRRRGGGVLLAAAVIVGIVLAVALLKVGVGRMRNEMLSQLAPYDSFLFEEQLEPGDLEWDDGGDEEDWWEYEEDYQGDREWWEYDSQYLTDEEAAAEGRHCLGDGHFEIRQEDMEALIHRLWEEQGYGENIVGRRSENAAYYDDDGVCINSFFSSYVIFYQVEHGELVYDSQVELDCDTATGELHSVEIRMQDKQAAIEMTVEILKYIEAECGLDPGICSDTVRREMPGRIESEEGYDWTEADINVNGECYNNSYWIWIDVVAE